MTCCSLSVLCVLALAALPSAAVAADRPHVVIIMVDDMGYGDPGCYNANSKIPTPNIDRLARDGMRFTDAHAPGPLCHLSRYGLLTGRYPFRTNVGRWRSRAVIESDRLTLPGLLRGRGYQTAMVGKWHLGFDENGYDRPLPGGPVDRGFDSFFGIRASTDIPPYFYIRGNRAVAPPTEHVEANSSEGWSPIQGAFWRAGGIAPGFRLENVLPRLTDEAIDVIRGFEPADSGQRLMLYLAYPAPHTPWLPSEEFRTKSGAGLYGDFAVMVDAMIGRVLRALDEAGLADDTLVIFTSDNGPVWYEQDVQRLGHDSSGGLRGMKADAWEAGHRMPFLVRWPGVVKAGSVSDQLVCFTDLLPTLADMTGKPAPRGAAPDGMSFLPVLAGRAATQEKLRSRLVMQSGSGLMTVREGGWKLITGLGSGGFSKPSKVRPGPNDPAGQLYDLDTDPGETTNLYADHPEVVARLRAILREVRASEAAAGAQ